MLHIFFFKELETTGAAMDTSGTAQLIHVKVRIAFVV